MSLDSDRRTSSRPAKKPKLTFKLVVLTFSVLLFAILDLIAGSLTSWEVQQGSFRAAHPYYHHGLLPNQDRVTSWGGDDYKLITNSLGFRDRRVHDVQLQSSKRRVVLIGDSMIEGLGVEFEDTITGRLQERWSDRNVDVLNAGVVSYSPRIYELKTRYLLEKEGLKFDHLVVFIDISDIQDELFYEAFQPHQLDESNKNPASPHPQPG